MNTQSIIKMPAQPKFARYQGQIYACTAFDATHVQLTHPQAIGPYPVNVAISGKAVMVPGMVKVKRQSADFLKAEPVAPLPAKPAESGVQVGARFKWGTSFAEWVVLSVESRSVEASSVESSSVESSSVKSSSTEGGSVKARQVGGWNESMIYDVPVSELKLI